MELAHQEPQSKKQHPAQEILPGFHTGLRR
jgi:hypothetical protein